MRFALRSKRIIAAVAAQALTARKGTASIRTAHVEHPGGEAEVTAVVVLYRCQPATVAGLFNELAGWADRLEGGEHG